MADRRISELTPIQGDELQPDVDLLVIVDVSTNETKNITPAALAQGAGGNVPLDSLTGSQLKENTITDRELADGSVGTDQLVDGSVTADKLDPNINIGGTVPDNSVGSSQIKEDAIDGDIHIQDRSIPGIKLEQNTVTSAEIATNSIGADELADGAVDTAAIQDDALSTSKYQNLSVTDAKLASGIDGSKIQDGSISGDKLEAGAISGDAIGDIGLDSLPNAPANHFIAGPTVGVDAAPVYRPIDPQDLPAAKENVKGAVIIPASGGLNVTASGDVGIANSVTPGSFSIITFDQHGLVTSGRALDHDDLPALQPEDMPPLSYDMITSGQVQQGSLAECAVTGPNICDYATCYLQETQPVGQYLGQFWYQPSTAQLRVFAGGSGQGVWAPVGFGALQANNLRWGGTYNADTDKLVVLTDAGTSAGLTAGSSFPVATDQMSGLYFICEVGGANCTQPSLNGKTHSEGDWALCIDETQGWVQIKNSAGGGGGGGATRLNDLLDVEVGSGSSPTLTDANLIRYDGSAGLWRNTDVIDGGSID